MKVLEIERVVPNLIDCVRRKRALPNFEFKHEHDTARNQQDIDPLPHSGHGEFE